jgi:Flp pilus assembly protein CpaB
MRAIALPVSTAAHAVGGAIVPGARVDIIAVPIAGRAPGGRTAELLMQGAMVLDVRSETGSAYGVTSSKGPVSSFGERIGSVVVAIAPLDEVRFADRIATSTFVLALAGSH